MFAIRNIDVIDSPALVIVEETVVRNIRLAKKMAGDVSRLRPHVKTNKTREVCQLMMREGITKFKCATIAEAEMLALTGAPDILLAYQPTGPKVKRLLQLAEIYPGSRFSFLADDLKNVEAIDAQFSRSPLVPDVIIDVNVGMNRTGIVPELVPGLAKGILALKHLRLAGLHGYDGHVHETSPELRKRAADSAFAKLEMAWEKIQTQVDYPLARMAGGTITFPIHIRRPEIECSPGTFVFWDWGYSQLLPELPFEWAAFLVCRVISVVDKLHVCIDLGYKSVASEKPLPRVHFPDAPEIKPVSQSEEHLVLEVPDSARYPVGTVLYGIPEHICPTVALYEKMLVARNSCVEAAWKIIARDRCITI